ncbi:MAG: hypothetical protein P8177_00460 [Gemmatimonadota bacterium]|jgi:hypothetical protein
MAAHGSGRIGPLAVGLSLAVAALTQAGCAASRSDLEGGFHGSAPAGVRADAVTVAFIFTHTHQSKGWDVVPKVDAPNRFANGFYDLFRDALPELSNIESYATFTDRADDVTDPSRRALRDSLTTGSHDYVIHMRFVRETSFARLALGTLASTVTLTLLPVPYGRHYSVSVDVTDRSGESVKRYERTATVTQWIQTLLVFVYPFHPEARKTEEVYLEFLHDVFREIEADRILRVGMG